MKSAFPDWAVTAATYVVSQSKPDSTYFHSYGMPPRTVDLDPLVTSVLAMRLRHTQRSVFGHTHKYSSIEEG